MSNKSILPKLYTKKKLRIREIVMNQYQLCNLGINVLKLKYIILYVFNDILFLILMVGICQVFKNLPFHYSKITNTTILNCSSFIPTPFNLALVFMGACIYCKWDGEFQAYFKNYFYWGDNENRKNVNRSDKEITVLLR